MMSNKTHAEISNEATMNEFLASMEAAPVALDAICDQELEARISKNCGGSGANGYC
jgi:hypothetical protein